MMRFITLVLVSSLFAATGGCSVLEAVTESQQHPSSSATATMPEQEDSLQSALKQSQKERRKVADIEREFRGWRGVGEFFGR